MENQAAVLALISMAGVLAERLLQFLTAQLARLERGNVRTIPRPGVPVERWSMFLQDLRERVTTPHGLLRLPAGESLDDSLQNWLSVLDGYLDHQVTGVLEHAAEGPEPGRQALAMHADVVRRLANGRAALLGMRPIHPLTGSADRALALELFERELARSRSDPARPDPDPIKAGMRSARPGGPAVAGTRAGPAGGPRVPRGGTGLLWAPTEWVLVLVGAGFSSASGRVLLPAPHSVPVAISALRVERDHVLHVMRTGAPARDQDRGDWWTAEQLAEPAGSDGHDRRPELLWPSAGGAADLLEYVASAELDDRVSSYAVDLPIPPRRSSFCVFVDESARSFPPIAQSVVGDCCVVRLHRAPALGTPQAGAAAPATGHVFPSNGTWRPWASPGAGHSRLTHTLLLAHGMQCSAFDHLQSAHIAPFETMAPEPRSSTLLLSAAEAPKALTRRLAMQSDGNLVVMEDETIVVAHCFMASGLPHLAASRPQTARPTGPREAAFHGHRGTCKALLVHDGEYLDAADGLEADPAGRRRNDFYDWLACLEDPAGALAVPDPRAIGRRGSRLMPEVGSDPGWHSVASSSGWNSYGSLRLGLLEAFVALSEELHFTRAAHRLFITQSGLGRRISQLERTLGATLVTRSTRYVELTTAGDALLPHARAVLSAGLDAASATRWTSRPLGRS